MSEFPISCVLCRRKKIKCNKRKPCNQCNKKGTICEFPEKFRNISISVEDEEQVRHQSDSSSSNILSGSSGSPLEANKLNDEIALLRKEKLAMLHENFQLSQRNHDLKGKLQAVARTSNTETPPDHGFEISGETTELGHKYYGPQLSNYMIEALRLKDDENQEDASEKKENPDPLSKQHERVTGDDTDIDTDEVSISKKPLPWVVEANELPQKNIEVLIHLVEHFFSISSYRCFISKINLIDFINNHHAIKDAEWENDDDLILLYMVLIMTVQRITPLKYNESGISSDPVSLSQELYKRTAKLIKKCLYRGFTRLRHNLLNESVVTVQTYILCTEWYFIDQRYEEAWSMVFHCCSVAYSIGLHVMVSMRTTSALPEGASHKLAELSKHEDGKSHERGMASDGEESDENNNEDYDVIRIKVWYALKSISGQLCSVLGRPNPILIQVNLVVLYTSASSSVAKMELEKSSTQVQLKIGLSECLRLSNMMLIESFMMNFTMDDIVRLDNRFKKEAEVLMWFVSDDYQRESAGRTDEVNEWSHIPLCIDRTNALSDLIILYINRAKLLEPFLNQFVEGPQSDYLFDSICESVLLFLDYICDFVLYFLTQETPKFLNEDGSVGSRLRLGKAFRTMYPFLSSFFYQGVIVIFTLLNYRAKQFIIGEHLHFLRLVGTKLTTLMKLDSKVSSILEQGVHLWSTNIVYLINKDTQHVNMLLDKAEEYRNHAMENKDAMNVDFDRVLADTFDINMKDPFWFTNPDNLPYYLSSPSEDENGMIFDQHGGTHTNMPLQAQGNGHLMNQVPYQPQPHSANFFARDTLNNYSQYNQWDPRQDTFGEFLNGQMGLSNQDMSNQALPNQAILNQSIPNQGIPNQQGYVRVGNEDVQMDQRIQPPIQNQRPIQNQPPMQNVFGENYVKMPYQMNDEDMDPEPVKMKSASEVDYAKSESMPKDAFMEPGFSRRK